MNRHSYFVAAIFFLSCGTSLLGQTTAEVGLPLEDSTYDSLPMLTYYPLNDRGGVGGDIPVRIDLKPFCPKPGDQGETATCVGFALAHTLSILVASGRSDKYKNKKYFDFSAYYIFNQIGLGPDCKDGAYLSKGLELLQTQGCCLKKDFPYGCRHLPTEADKQKAQTYHIAKYERLFPSNATEKMKLDQIRVSLAMGRPIVAGMYVPAEMRDYPLKSNAWERDSPKVGHAWVVVGYDEQKEEFELMNSYGVNWGEQGFIKLSYADMAANVRYAYWLKLP